MKFAKIPLNAVLRLFFEICRLYVLWYFGYRDWPYQHDLYDVLDTRNYDRVFEE